jgi:hypothetical protein
MVMVPTVVARERRGAKGGSKACGVEARSVLLLLCLFIPSRVRFFGCCHLIRQLPNSDVFYLES